jgi:uncharacterized membrane protein YtjA (UPF0391 family)
MPAPPLQSATGNYSARRRLNRAEFLAESNMLRWAIVCLVISLVAGALGFTGISGFAKRLSIIFFALFFIGFLILLGFAYLVVGAVAHADLLPAMVAIST